MTVQAFRTSVQCSSDTAAELRRQVLANPHRADAKLVVVFASPKTPLEQLTDTLSATHPGAVVLGCSTAGEFTDAGEAAGTVTVFVLAGELKVSGGIGHRLRGETERSVEDACSSLHDVDGVDGYHTALMFADGLAFVGEEAALLAAIRLGPSVSIAGASAGDDLALERTVVSMGTEVTTDAVSIALISSSAPISIGVSHGHRPLGSEGTVTRAEGNVVHEIDGRPAWQAYREATKAAAEAAGIFNSNFEDPTEFVSYMASFEAGLAIEGGYKVRAALLKGADDSLSFVCQMAEGTKFAYMGSDLDGQIESARDAAEMAREGLGDSAVAGVLVFECACRKIILQDQFSRAVEAISSSFPSAPIAGAEMYGEIALHGGSLSAYHNSTTVVVAFGKGE